MIWLPIGTYYLGALLVVFDAIIHPGSQPYIPSYERGKKRILANYWLHIAAVAVLWLPIVIILGIMDLHKELS